MKVSRRSFCGHSAKLTAGALFLPRFTLPVAPPANLSFSTLGCPDWPFSKIIDFATANGYTGLEFRGLKREMDLTKADIFSTDANLRATVQLMKVAGLKFTDLGSSSELHHADTVTAEKNLDEAKKFIGLAERLGCPFIRVFPNKFPPGEDRDIVLDRVAARLRSLGEFAKNTSVTVLMETHGDLTRSADVVRVMKTADHPHTGLVWDVVNMWSVTGEAPKDVYAQLKPFIKHTHLKDMKRDTTGDHYTLFGTGVAPVFEAIDALIAGGYPGYYSFEWEKLWHPDIAEPELALAGFPKAIRQHYAG